MNDQRLERALRAGPPYASPYLPIPLPLEKARSTRMPTLKVALVATALLLAALGASIVVSGFLFPTRLTGGCPPSFREADAVDTSVPGLTRSQRAFGSTAGAPGAVRPGLVAAFAWDAQSAPLSVITIDPARGARCRLVTFVEDKMIRANISQLDWSPMGDALAIGVENPPDPKADGDPSGQTGEVLIWTNDRLLRVWLGQGQTPRVEWAPDGRSVAVWMEWEPVHLILADGSATRDFGVRPYRLKWSPDGSRWIVSENTGGPPGTTDARTIVSVVDVADGRITPIDPGIDLNAEVGWLDNGRALLVKRGSGLGRTQYLDVPLAAPAGYSVVHLPADVSGDGYAFLSPDAHRMAYLTTGGDLEIADIAGASAGILVQLDAGDFWPGPAWAPDGTGLVFATRDASSTDSNAIYTLQIVNANGTGLRQTLTGNLSTMDDPWQPVPIR